MMIDRRTFVKTATLGATLGILNPTELLAAQTNPDKSSPSKSPYSALNFDVIVVGAGASGIPAAIAAAREGAKVVLLEEDMIPGGAPVDSYVTFICGAPRVGLFQKMVSALNEHHTLSGTPVASFKKDGMDGKNHWWHPTAYLYVIRQLLKEQSNITLMCGAHVVDAIVKEKGKTNQVQGVRIFRNGHIQDILAKVTIDATGMGLVSERAGAQVLFGRESKSDYNEEYGLDKGDGRTQPCTWMFISQRIRRDAVLPREALKGGAVEDNLNKWVMKDEREEMIRRDAGIYLHWGATAHCKDTRDPVELANTQMECFEKLQTEIPALEAAGFSCNLAPKMGVRECRRIKGEYVLSLSDIQKGIFPDDTVAHAWYDLDPWGMNLTREQKVVPPYGIPYRSLIPLGIEGLLTAGRIISGTHIAASSYRVQPICSNTGEAAGTAAAMAAQNNTSVRNIDLKQLQNKLEKNGLFEKFNRK
jgi:hypothetical protein